MTTDHKPLDTIEFSNKVKSALFQDADIKSFQSFGAIEDITLLQEAWVTATLVSVYFEKANMQSPMEYSTLVQSIYAFLNENPRCMDIQSFDNCMVAVFETPFKPDIDNALDSVGKINALFKMVNKQHKAAGVGEIKKGIGMIYGQVLMNVLSMESEPICDWSGEIFQTVLSYSKEAATEGSLVYVSYSIYNNLKEDYQKLFRKDPFGNKYFAQPVNIAMDKWNNSNE